MAAPEDITLTIDTDSFVETIGLNGTVGDLEANEPDDGEEISSFSLVSGEGDADNEIFSIVQTDGDGTDALDDDEYDLQTLTDKFDFEDKSSYSIRVRATDSAGESSEEVITFELGDVEPAIDTGTELNVSESANDGATVGFVPLTADSDTNSLSYSIVGGNEDDIFAINGDTGEITVSDSSSLDAESDASPYALTISATDGSTTSIEAVTVNVTDVAPNISGEQDDFTVAEDASNDTVVGEIENTGDTTGVEYRIGEFDGDQEESIFTEATDGPFSVNSDGEIIVSDTTKLTQESYTLTVVADDDDSSDTRGNIDSETTVTIEVENVNQAPNFKYDGSVLLANESSAVVPGTAAQAEDPDGDNFTYSITGGADQELFEIDEATGELSFNSIPNFENPADANGNNIYLVQVSATDERGLSASEDLRIRVDDTTLALETDENASLSVVETAVNGTSVGFVTPNNGDRSANFTITDGEGNDSTIFAIDSAGEITLIDSSAIDADSESFTVEVTATDGRTSEGPVEYTITVADNEAPAFTGANDFSSEVEENTTTVTELLLNNEEGDSLTYSFDGADGSLFTVNDEGELQFINAPNFESPIDADGDNVYEVEVTATDAGGLSDSAEFSVTVEDVNEAPSITNRINVQENSIAVATLEASDADGEADFTYTIAGGADSDMFAISDGELSFVEAPDFETPMDADEDNIYEVQVMATSEEDTAMQTFRVNVTDMNENGMSGSGRDFDGDGDSDILLVGSNGQVSVLLMDGSTVEEQRDVLTLRNRSWEVQGMGDFNADGTTDLFWRNSAGVNAMWLMNGEQFTVQTLPRVRSQNWEVTNVADYSGDGQADLVWNNRSTGAVALWEMNDNLSITGSIIVDPSVV
ncbi:MAG: cadherin domain-containing protein [Cyanophyceae cyanobacterium]